MNNIDLSKRELAMLCIKFPSLVKEVSEMLDMNVSASREACLTAG